MSRKPLVFDSVSLQEESVVIADKEYVLREASGDTAVQYRNKTMAGMALSDGKLSRIESLADAEPFLVSRCLFECGEIQKNVPESTVRSWPNRIQKALFDRAKEISSLDDELTVEQIDEQIKKLQEQRAKLVEDELGN